MKKQFICILCAFTALFTQPLSAQWTKTAPSAAQFIVDASFLTDQKVVIMTIDSTEQIYQTTNGGQQWNSIQMPVWASSDPFFWRGIQFLDEQTGFAYGDWLVGGGVFAGGTESFAVFATTDGGNTWTLHSPTTPNAGFYSLSTLHFFNAQQGVATVSTGLSYSLVLTTDDGGQNWQTGDTLNNLASSMKFDSDGTGNVIRYQHSAGQNAKIFSLYDVQDFGKTWTDLGTPDLTADWPERRIGLWHDQQLYMGNNRVLKLEPPVVPTASDITYSFSDDNGQFWYPDYFVAENFGLEDAQIRNNTFWIRTREGLFWRTLTVNLDMPTCFAAEQTLLYPNPVQRGASLNVPLSSTILTPITLEIYAPGGRLCHRQPTTTDQRVQLPLLAPGAYSLLLSTNGKVISKQTLVIVE